MRELHGVMFAGLPNIKMKKRALLFDKFQIWSFNDPEYKRTDEFEADIDYLKEAGIAIEPPLDADDYTDVGFSAIYRWVEQVRSESRPEERNKSTMIVVKSPTMRDFTSRAIAAKSGERLDHDVVPVCELELPHQMPNSGQNHVQMAVVISVISETFPTPDESCAWQDILDFKSEVKNKLWDFRRFLYDLANKSQTEAEIKDRLAWTLHEYTKWMKHTRLKIVSSSVAAFVVPATDLIFNFQGNHTAAIVGAGVALSKLRIELMEGEMKPVGRECAYVFDARKRFGK